MVVGVTPLLLAAETKTINHKYRSNL